MKKFFMSFLLLFLILFGCASGEGDLIDDVVIIPPSPSDPAIPYVPAVGCPVGHEYEIRFNSKIDESWKQTMLEAIKEWKFVLGDSFNYYITSGDSTQIEFPCVFSVYSANDLKPGTLGSAAWKANDSNKRTEWAGIWLHHNIQKPDEQWTVALHEFGHALGLDHNEKKSDMSIMWPWARVPGELSCADYVNVCAIWGCNTVCRPKIVE